MQVFATVWSLTKPELNLTNGLMYGMHNPCTFLSGLVICQKYIIVKDLHWKINSWHQIIVALTWQDSVTLIWLSKVNVSNPWWGKKASKIPWSNRTQTYLSWGVYSFITFMVNIEEWTSLFDKQEFKGTIFWGFKNLILTWGAVGQQEKNLINRKHVTTFVRQQNKGI